MLNDKNMMVVIDPSSESQPALEQAEEIALSYGAKLTALLCVYDRAAEIDTVLGGTLLKNLRKPVLAKKREWLEQLLRPYRDRGLDITAKVEWEKHEHEIINRLVETNGYGLIIKTAHHNSALKRILFTPVDWKLIRTCKASTLFIQKKAALRGGQLLLALDLMEEDKDLEQMNRFLLEETIKVAETLNLDINLVNAYPSIYVFATFAPQEFSPPIIQKNIKDAHHDALQVIAERYNIDKNRTFLQEGLVGSAVTEVANDICAGIVVVGSHSRVGIPGFFYGNSAESILETIDRNLLVLKPAAT